jgi:hypothetical protein
MSFQRRARPPLLALDRTSSGRVGKLQIESTDWLLLCTARLEVSPGADHNECDAVP